MDLLHISNFSFTGIRPYLSNHCEAVQKGDECGNLADFRTPNLALNYSFSKFSFKVRLAALIFFL